MQSDQRGDIDHEGKNNSQSSVPKAQSSARIGYPTSRGLK